MDIVSDYDSKNNVINITEVNDVTNKEGNKKIYSDTSFEMRNIDKYYFPKVIFGTNMPNLSTEDLKKLDPKCKSFKKILVLYTGGTIGMCKKDGAYEPEPNFFCRALHKLPMFNDSRFRKEIDISGNVFVMPRSPDDIRVIYNVWEFAPLLDSSDITLDDYVRIAKDIKDEYDNYDGFIILHGTDTMSFTGSALSFLFENLTKPIILTGSQIPLFEIRSDGRENLLAALIIASHYDIPEVTLLFHDKLFRANRTSKMSSVHFDAFDSPNYPTLADVGISIRVHTHRILVPSKPVAPLQVHTDMCADVSVMRMFPSITKATVKAFLTSPIKGVVLLTYGSGNMPFCRKDLLELFREAYNRGCIIINITQCWKGGVKAIYRTGFILKEYGIYPGLDMTVEAALNKLSYVLARSDWSIETKRIAMTRNLCGELTLSETEVTREQRTLSQDGIVMDSDIIIGAALCANAKEGNVAMIEQIGKRRGNWEAADYNGKTALHVGVSENQTEVVRFLLEKGVSVNTKDCSCLTPLRCAVSSRSNLTIIRELRSKGAVLDMANEELYRELSNAIHKNDLSMLELYLEAGIDVNTQYENGNTVLHLACIYRRLHFVQMLLATGCDSQLKNEYNNTAFEEAAVREFGEICEVFSNLDIGQ